LGRVKILNRTLECRTAVNKKVKALAMLRKSGQFEHINDLQGVEWGFADTSMTSNTLQTNASPPATQTSPTNSLGSSGTYQAIISLTELSAALTRDQLSKLLSQSFTRHVRTHPSNYQYRPTADCDQVYSVLPDGKIFTCATCLTLISTQCGAVSHEGLTCDQYKSVILGDDAFAGWRMKNDARDCPKCGCTIQESEGCHHMNCKGFWSTYLLGVYVGFEEGEGDVLLILHHYFVTATMVRGLMLRCICCREMRNSKR